MTNGPIQTLIDKLDTFEMVGTRVAEILAAESASQVALATTAGKPTPSDWALRVYQDRATPWTQFVHTSTGDDVDPTPIVNVWWESSAFDRSKSNMMSRQFTGGIFNIDVYGYGFASDTASGGHIPADKAAADNMHRAVRLVRNILMASVYTNLDFDRSLGLVSNRFINSITTFQPQEDPQAVQHIVATRVSLAVDFNEVSEQYVAQPLCFVNVTIERQEDGLIFAQADYDYTT